MRFLPRQALPMACVSLLVVAGIGMAWSLRTPDPLGRAGWRNAPVVVAPGAPASLEIYLPACGVEAIRVHAAPGAAGAVTARVEDTAAAGRAPQRLVLASGGSADVALGTTTPRTRVTLALATEDAPLRLASPRPVSLVAREAGAFGLLPCAVADRPAAFAVLAVALTLHLVGLGWLAGRVGARSARRADPTVAADSAWPVSPVLAAALVATSVLVYMVLVPPFEPPDELAHLQYARFVATTGGLPREVAPPGSEWRDSVYEWVQQPGYYYAAAAVLRVAGVPFASPRPQPHPQSRLQGGPDVAIYQHPDTASAAGTLRNVWLLRGLSLALAVLTIWCAARAVHLVTGDRRLAGAAAAAVALVPQWAAVMGSISTDPPATCAAAVATWLVCRYLRGASPAASAAFGIGLVTGLAYAVKVTTVFLVPMMALALIAVARRDGARLAMRHGAAAAGGLLLAAAWIPLRAWLVFGDPLARAFKREVLAVGGFAVTEGPPIFSLAFADDLRRMVFEPFWARFGSLGAGPLPGTRLWWIYGAVTLALVVLLVAGTVMAARVAWRMAVRRAPAVPAEWALLACAVGVGSGLGLWAWVNLVPQADVIVHWTPRHILPLTAPLLVVTAAGLQTLAAGLPSPLRMLVRPAASIAVLVLAVTGLAVVRSVILGFHFGF